MSQIIMIRAGSRVLDAVTVGSRRRLELVSSCLEWQPARRHASNMATKAVTLENLNPNIIKLEYAVRGPLVIRAGEIEKELEKVSFPYDSRAYVRAAPHARRAGRNTSSTRFVISTSQTITNQLCAIFKSK